MAFRLVATLHGKPQKYLLEPGENLIGSDPGCPIRLPHPTVSRRHAVLRLHAEALELEDLGSSNGTRLAGRRVRGPEPVLAGAELELGQVQARIEEVAAAELATGVALAAPSPPREAPAKPAGHHRSTVSLGGIEAFALGPLPELVEQLLEGGSRGGFAQRLGAALFEALPCSSVRLGQAQRDQEAPLFVAERAPDEPAGLSRFADDALALSVAFVSPAAAQLHAPVVRAAWGLLRLAWQAGPSPGRGGPPRPRAPGTPVPPPDPPSLAPRLREIYAQSARLAPSTISVLIHGESGTGKEVLARYLHRASNRAAKPFVALNCAALPRDLLEAELFGIERGVATGVGERPGKFEQAHEGTLFLDEIGDMALETQAKILRVLQEGEVFRLGGREPRPARVRVVSATNRDLAAMREDGRFRLDLYHRIADWVVELPPLRERAEDIANLAAFFLGRESERLGIGFAGISQAALDALTAHAWPGNIRQLEREMARAALFLEPGELLESSRLAIPKPTAAPLPSAPSLDALLLHVERQAIESALTTAQGDTATAAQALGIGRSTLYRRMKVLGIET
jgi:hypothetical protein